MALGSGQIASVEGPPFAPSEIRYIPHHFATRSAFMLMGFDEAAIVTADGRGETICESFAAKG
jgi:predicted NodU family carbamoyl transferase